MATAHIDSTEDLNTIEENGIIIQLRRKVKIVDLSNTNNDAQTLKEAGTVLTSNGLSPFSTPTGFGNLMLTRRSINIMNDPTQAECLLDYLPIADSGAYFHWEGSSNLNSITSFTDKWGTPIELSHTFLENEFDNRGGKTDTQGGEISVNSPRFQLTGTGIATAADPVVVVASWINTVNSRTWWGIPAGQWLCTNVQYKPIDVSLTPMKYMWTFSFEVTAYEHDPHVYYIDSTTNRIPEGLVPGVGSKFVTWYNRRDFNEAFPT